MSNMCPSGKSVLRSACMKYWRDVVRNPELARLFKIIPITGYRLPQRDGFTQVSLTELQVLFDTE